MVRESRERGRGEGEVERVGEGEVGEELDGVVDGAVKRVAEEWLR